MTYKQLLNQLQQLEEWQLESDVILWNGNFDEYCEKCSLTFASDTQDVFDEGTPLICF